MNYSLIFSLTKWTFLWTLSLLKNFISELPFISHPNLLKKWTQLITTLPSSHTLSDGIDDIPFLYSSLIWQHLEVLISSSQIFFSQIYSTTTYTLNSPPFLVTIFHVSSLTTFLKTYLSKYTKILICGFVYSIISQRYKSVIFIKIAVKSRLLMWRMIQHSFEKCNLIERFIYDKIETNSWFSFFRCKFNSFLIFGHFQVCDLLATQIQHVWKQTFTYS